MRAVLVGLLAAGLLGGGAQAKTCALTGLMLKATARDPGAARDVIGSNFTVVRASSAFKTGPDPAKGGTTTRGTITVEIQGQKGKFLVVQDYEPTAMPWVSAASEVSPGSARRVSWGERNKVAEANLFEPIGSFDIYSGPLDGVTLEPTNCALSPGEGKFNR